VSQPARPARTPPVAFDDAAWAEDMRRSTIGARRIAMPARAEYESSGAPIAEPRACDPEGPGGTALRACAKLYVPPPVGPHGLVLHIVRRNDGRLGLVYLAFGLRHPGADVQQPSVYEIAHRRLHGSAPA
jgi:hypothetical protein